MYVHKPSGLAYLANPRTASRATAAALLRVGFVMEGSHHSGFGPGGRKACCPLRTFTTTRPEEELIASWGRFFDCAIQEVPERMQKQRAIIEGWTYGYLPHLNDADIILRFSALEGELNRLLAQHSIPHVALERIT